MLDVMTIFKDRRDYPHKLSDAINAYKLENQNSHRAISDAKATLSILLAMEQEKYDLNKYINLFGYNPKYGISGPRISSVTYLPQGYYRKEPLYEQLV
jgi:DNA polymerase-3 subunit epsilon